MSLSAWTAADGAELDVLLHGLVDASFDHRQRGCRACDPEPCPFHVEYRDHRDGCWKCQHGVKVATDYYGEPCSRYLAHLEHGETCPRCIPCPHVTKAVRVVVEWRAARMLLSRAAQLRAEQDALEAA